MSRQVNRHLLRWPHLWHGLISNMTRFVAEQRTYINLWVVLVRPECSQGGGIVPGGCFVYVARSRSLTETVI
jgi:hypothetical protein